MGCLGDKVVLGLMLLLLLFLLLLVLLLLGADEAKGPVREVKAAKDDDGCKDLWGTWLAGFVLERVGQKGEAAAMCVSLIS